MGLLESALYRPQTGYYDELPEMAAALLESLLINHPFLDGNKRMAFFLTDTFLRMNGYQLRVEAKPAQRFILKYIDRSPHDLPKLVEWVQRHLSKA